MRISYNWLKDYVDVKIPPEKAAEIFTMSGLPIESIERLGDDHILEAEVTANRPDLLSMIGVSRELAAITGRKLKLPLFTIRHPSSIKKRTTPVRRSLGEGGIHDSPITIKVEDKKLCPKYTARIIRDVTVKESPDWLKKRMEVMGLRPVNNIVDITNFSLFETGEPMHAFDLDKIRGEEVIIRRARTGEKITTIDGVERTLNDSTLVIADSVNAIAIAGVMGGLDTEVTGSTKNILLEAAYFDPISVRRTSRKLGLATESSYRFERKVDLENILASSNRASNLICELAAGLAGKFIDISTNKKAKKLLDLRYERLNKILGVEIATPKIKNILTSLGLTIKSSSKDKATIEVPSFRNDLQSEIDLIEEVARIYGYNKIPDTIPNIVEDSSRISFDMIAEDGIRRRLASLGMDEIMTYSLIGRKLLNLAGIPSEDVVEIKNPLTSEQEIARPTLQIGILNSILWNIARKNKDLRLFELGNIYLKNSSGDFSEKKYLSMAITGEVYSSWLGGGRDSSFFDLKGIVETLLSELGIEKFSFKDTKDEFFSPGASASVDIKGQSAGILGKVSRKVLNNFDIKSAVFSCEIYVDSLLKHAALEKKFTEIPKYPALSRDISIIIAKGVTNSEIVSTIKNAAGGTLKKLKLVDRYTGKQIPDDKVGLTYSLEYQDPRKTLEEKDVSDLQKSVLRALEENLSAKLR